ncbi:GNAT family N-acetyltransferase [Halococcus sp. AFM35]|uniref:GNAT family N-acetyltransferase n=1 Tax=Halococcus sp. AFM35 TaxID=3421653 RepID=UPI003EBD57DA
MSGTVFIDGDSIDLRTVEEEDIEFLVRGVNHPNVRRYISAFRLPQNAERYGETFENIDSSDSGATLLIHADGDPVGSVQLYPIDDSRGWANLGCWVVPERQKNGYAIEACERIVAYGFRELRLHRISGVVMTSNTASQRLLERIGFTHEGTKRESSFAEGAYVDEEQYGLLESEWREQRDGTTP